MKRAHDVLEKMCKLAKTNTNKKYEDNITKKVMAIIFVFFICNITSQFVIFGARCFRIIGYTLAVSLFDLSAVVNGTVNAVIYGFFDKKFRKIFKKMICPCIKPEPEPSPFHSRRESSRKFSLIRSVSLINNPSMVTSPMIHSKASVASRKYSL